MRKKLVLAHKPVSFERQPNNVTVERINTNTPERKNLRVKTGVKAGGEWYHVTDMLDDDEILDLS